MRAMILDEVAPLSEVAKPLRLVEWPEPVAGPHELLIRVSVCGVCHTELDEIEGRLRPSRLPIVLGHQVIGRVHALGGGSSRFQLGERVGVGWIHHSSGGRDENLSAEFQATGCDVDGGYAEFMTIGEDYAVAIPEVGRPAISFDWYRSFLQMLLDAEAYSWMAPLIAYGELLIGIALILGAFTGIAAFFGALMNWNFMMAGSASSNPMLFIAAIGLMFAWKVAGYYGLDYFLLRWIGTPWSTAPSAQNETASAAAN